MIHVSDEYKEAMSQTIRNRSRVLVAVGEVNPMLQTNSEVASTNLNYLSEKFTGKDSCVFKDGSNSIYTTAEQNFTKADGKMLFPPREEDEMNLAIDTGMVSEAVFDEENRVSLTVDLPSEEIELPLYVSVEFVEAIPERVSMFLSWSDGEHGYIVNPQTTRSRGNRYIAKFVTMPAEYGDTISCVVSCGLLEESDKTPRRARIRTVVFGDGSIFSEDIVTNVSINNHSSITNDDLPSTDVSVSVLNYDARYDADNPNNPLKILDNDNQDINVYFGYDVSGEDDYEWLRAGSVVASEWQSKIHSAEIHGVDRIREDETLFIHSYNTLHDGYDNTWGMLPNMWIWYIISMMHLDIPYEYYYGEFGIDPMDNAIVETKTCKETLQKIAQFSGQTMYFNSEGRLVFGYLDRDDTREVYETDSFELDGSTINKWYYIPDLSVANKGIVNIHIVGYDNKRNKHIDVIVHAYMDEDTTNNRLQFHLYSASMFEMYDVIGTCYLETCRIVDDKNFDMSGDEIIEDIQANKGEVIGEIIVPYYTPNYVRSDSSEVARNFYDVSDPEQLIYQFKVDLGGTVYTDKYAYICDVESTISKSDFYQGDLNHEDGTNVTSTTALRSGFETVEGGKYYRIECDEDKNIVGYAEYSTNASSGFIRWVDVGESRTVIKTKANTTRIRIVLAYPDETTIEVRDMDNIRLSAILVRRAFKTPNDYVILTADKYADFPDADEIELFVTAKGYINFTSREYVLKINDKGKSMRWDNPLVFSSNSARRIAERLAVEKGNNITYNYKYRGNPELEVGDIIKQGNDFFSNMKVAVTDHRIGFDGALDGNIVSKRRT